LKLKGGDSRTSEAFLARLFASCNLTWIHCDNRNLLLNLLLATHQSFIENVIGLIQLFPLLLFNFRYLGLELVIA
jgi:hypothetical protein